MLRIVPQKLEETLRIQSSDDAVHLLIRKSRTNGKWFYQWFMDISLVPKQRHLAHTQDSLKWNSGPCLKVHSDSFSLP